VLTELCIVGRARTQWTRREDAPHQPSAAATARGILVIDPAYREGLRDLETFGRIWILFLFDRSRGWASRVKPPRGGPKRGVFATRAPNRPSQIGLTATRLVRIDVVAGEVEVEGIDLLDGTPIIDLKPYVPEIDAWPEAGHGWLEPFRVAGVTPRLKKPYRPLRSDEVGPAR
jgi:tRNA-Thr(GGU) m(6)t(6)A37 methyltransferase TsaA